MKILYIDYQSPKGHVQFNRIHLNSLTQLGEVYTIFKENYLEFIHSDLIKTYINIPSSKYDRDKGRFWGRFTEIQLLRYLKKNINPTEWDFIIISSYDVISMFFARFFPNVIMFDHTIEGMDNAIKRFFYKRLSNTHTHIVFNESMAQKLYENGVNKVAVVPHGFIAMPTMDNSSHIREKLHIDTDYIFLPSPTSVSKEEIQSLISSHEMITCLRQHGLKLVLRGDYISSSSNVVIIKDFLSENEYRDLFLNSKFLFLPYRSTFKYRVSGVLFECMANNKFCICSNIPALREYEKYFNYPNHFYSNQLELIQCIEYLISNNDIPKKYKNLKDLESPLNGWINVLNR